APGGAVPVHVGVRPASGATMGKTRGPRPPSFTRAGDPRGAPPRQGRTPSHGLAPVLARVGVARVGAPVRAQGGRPATGWRPSWRGRPWPAWVRPSVPRATPSHGPAPSWRRQAWPLVGPSVRAQGDARPRAGTVLA